MRTNLWVLIPSLVIGGLGIVAPMICLGFVGFNRWFPSIRQNAHNSQTWSNPLSHRRSNQVQIGQNTRDFVNKRWAVKENAPIENEGEDEDPTNHNDPPEKLFRLPEKALEDKHKIFGTVNFKKLKPKYEQFMPMFERADDMMGVDINFGIILNREEYQKAGLIHSLREDLKVCAGSQGEELLTNNDYIQSNFENYTNIPFCKLRVIAKWIRSAHVINIKEFKFGVKKGEKEVFEWFWNIDEDQEDSMVALITGKPTLEMFYNSTKVCYYNMSAEMAERHQHEIGDVLCRINRRVLYEEYCEKIRSGSGGITLKELYKRFKPSETIWFLYMGGQVKIESEIYGALVRLMHIVREMSNIKFKETAPDLFEGLDLSTMLAYVLYPKLFKLRNDLGFQRTYMAIVRTVPTIQTDNISKAKFLVKEFHKEYNTKTKLKKCLKLIKPPRVIFPYMKPMIFALHILDTVRGREFDHLWEKGDDKVRGYFEALESIPKAEHKDFLELMAFLDKNYDILPSLHLVLAYCVQSMWFYEDFYNELMSSIR